MSSTPLSTPTLLLTTFGLTLSTTFSIASLSLTYFAIPALLLPSTAPLMPPLELVAEARKRHFRTEKAPKNPADSGVGDEDEGLLDGGATQRVLRTDGNADGNTDTDGQEQNQEKKTKSGSPSSTSYLLRQWFHLFSKGMHSLPPCVLGSAACYLGAGVMLPGSLLDTSSSMVVAKRACFGVAAVLSVCTMVFTLTALKPVNEALHERVKIVVGKETGEGDGMGGKQGDVDDERKETEVLIRRWGLMNAWRALIPLVAGGVAVGGLVL